MVHAGRATWIPGAPSLVPETQTQYPQEDKEPGGTTAIPGLSELEEGPTLLFARSPGAGVAPLSRLTSASEPLWTDFTTTALFFSSMSKP